MTGPDCYSSSPCLRTTFGSRSWVANDQSWVAVDFDRVDLRFTSADPQPHWIIPVAFRPLSIDLKSLLESVLSDISLFPFIYASYMIIVILQIIFRKKVVWRIYFATAR